MDEVLITVISVRNNGDYMKKNKIIKILLSIVIVICSVFAVYFSLNDPEIKNKTQEEKKQEITEQYEEIGEEVLPDSVILAYQKEFNNNEIIGELEIPNTNLKVPIAHTVDNEFYLNHLLDKSYNTLGSIFLDYRNKIDDRKLIIYGHNSEDIYTEFNMLENYLNESYYQEHSDIYFRTLDDYSHYKIFSVYVAVADYRYINLNFSDFEYNEHLKYLKKQSIYDTGVSVNDGDEIIVLQTCYFEPVGSYLIVVAKKV